MRTFPVSTSRFCTSSASARTGPTATSFLRAPPAARPPARPHATARRHCQPAGEARRPRHQVRPHSPVARARGRDHRPAPAILAPHDPELTDAISTSRIERRAFRTPTRKKDHGQQHESNEHHGPDEQALPRVQAAHTSRRVGAPSSPDARPSPLRCQQSPWHASACARVSAPGLLRPYCVGACRYRRPRSQGAAVDL